MPFQFFRIPAQNLNAAAHELNRFLRSHHAQNNNGQNCRSANRNRPENRNNNYGFRVAQARSKRGRCRSTDPAAFPSRDTSSAGRIAIRTARCW